MIWAREKGICQYCKLKYSKGEKMFHIHHLIPFVTKIKRRDLDNLALLCVKCHNFVHSNKNLSNELIVSVPAITQESDYYE